MSEAEVNRQRHDIYAEWRAVFQTRGYRRQGDAAAARTVPSIAFYPGHRGAHQRQIDLVVTTVQHLIVTAERGLAMRASGGFGGHRFVGIARQRTAAAIAAQAARARSDTLGLLRPVWLLPFRRWQ